MRQFSPRARAYLVGCYVLGELALLWLVFGYHGPAPTVAEWLLGLGLAVVAAVCQVFVVSRTSTKGQRSDHLTPAPIAAALLLLPSPVLAAVLVATWLPEWRIRRQSWFAQLFNISTYLIAGALARAVLLFLAGEHHPGQAFAQPSLSLLLVIPLFVVSQTLLLAWVLKLARGQSFRVSGLFAPDKLFVEIVLGCVGLGFATAWTLDPTYGLVAALPLALIFQSLHVPNLKEEAATDPKTGLANMRHFNAAFARDLDRAERHTQQLSVLMCDLDYLRNINNTYGHQAGDIVLIGVADIIRSHIRDTDVAARFGGEEFVILLVDTVAEEAHQIAERLRSELEQSRFHIGTSKAHIGATISIGLASFPQDGRTAEALLHEADLAVYQAKRDGRNRVVVAGRTSRELAGEWAREHLVATPVAPPPRPEKKTTVLSFINRATRGSATPEPSGEVTANPVATRTIDGVAPTPRNRRKPDVAPLVRLLICTILVIGLLGLVPGMPFIDMPWWSIGMYAILSIIASQLAVDTAGQGLEQRAKTSVSVAVILSATFLYGELGILVTTLAAAISVGIKARSPLHRICFNLGTFLVSAEAAHRLFRLLTGGLIDQASSLAVTLLPAILAGLMYYVSNHLLLCLIRGLSERRSPWLIWQLNYRWLWPHYPVLGALGLIMTLGFVHFGALGVLAFMAPVAMMQVAIKQYTDRTTLYVDELRRMNGRLTDSYEATLQALSRALDTRDEETEEHSQRVRKYTELIAHQLDIPADELQHISRGALLHDIGKIGVPDAILLKPGKLTAEEVVVMRKHPEIGYSMIAHIPFLAHAAQVVLHHHEAYDGSGYPSGLSGANIPLGARIFAIADTFDAMTSDRPYRKALPASEAIAEIERCCGTQFDPDVVAAFRTILLSDLLAVRTPSIVPVVTSPMFNHGSLVLAEAQAA